LALDESAIVDSRKYAPDHYREWAAGTVVAVGDLYTPAVRNGYYYTATVAGTTGSTAPAWPTAAGTVTDGSVHWAYAGIARWAGAWDLNYAAAKLWELKSNKVAHLTNVSADGQTFSQGDLTGYFEKKARYYLNKRGIRSIGYRSATADRYRNWNDPCR